MVNNKKTDFPKFDILKTDFSKNMNLFTRSYRFFTGFVHPIIFSTHGFFQPMVLPTSTRFINPLQFPATTLPILQTISFPVATTFPTGNRVKRKPTGITSTTHIMLSLHFNASAAFQNLTVLLETVFRRVFFRRKLA